MYSKQNKECGKRQYHSSLVSEKGLNYNMGEIRINNYGSYPHPLASNLNFEDDEKLIKMSNLFQQTIEGLNESTYNSETDDYRFVPKTSLSPYRSNDYNYQHRDYYKRKSNEYNYEKPCLEYCQTQQRDQPHNLNDHILQYEYSNDFLPHSVQERFVNKNTSGDNNNNSYYCSKKSSGRFIGEYHRHLQSLSTAECQQLKSLEQTTPYFVNEQHYYSYFYNQNNCSSKLASTLGRGRKLPVTSKMPFSKKSSHSSEIQLNTKYESLKTKNFVMVDNCNDVENNRRSNYSIVLKEKSTNNNAVVAGLEKCSKDVFQAKTLGGDYLDLKQFEVYEYKNSQTFNEENSEADLLYLQHERSKRQLQSNSENGDGLFYCNQLPIAEVDNVSDTVNALNIYEKKKIQQKLQTLNKNEDIIYRHIKLPATPTKTKGATTSKKFSPPPKNRRVLIYNIQSPRLSRLSTSNIRLQRSKCKRHYEAKSDCKNLVIDLASSENKYDANNAQVLISRSHSTDLEKIGCESSKEERNQSENNSNSDDNSDDDDDNDFDNFSDLESSSNSDLSSDSEEGYRSNAYKLTHSLDVVSTSLSLESSINSETDIVDNPNALLVPSLFPNVPPYLAFSSNSKKGPEVPSDLYRILKWRVTNVMPRVVRSILANSGMRLLKKTNEWMGVWGKHMKSPCFKTIRPYQKINHLPGSFKIGRKDSCWKNLVKLMAKHGKKDFGFMPKTYIIPNDLKQLRKSWPKYSQKNIKWIIKPPASARGTGIRVVDRWAQIPKRKPLIVQKYIERPLLINGSKFDLRLYVLVTSINPLRVYMYHNGLARFASVKYSDKSDTLNDRCMHLTNYSINKFSSNYSKNEDVNACHGHKWTIKSLWTYLNNRGVRTDLLWAALRSLVLRTILAGENSINNMIRANVESKYSCFELFGFDVLLDADLVPWLLEVNISPSLHSELPLDSHVKAPLVQSVLNTALYNIPPKLSIERQREIAMEMSLPPGPICYDKRMYINYLSRTEKIKHNTFTRKSMEERDEYVNTILEHLTPDDVRCLVISEDELARCAPLERIFPTVSTYKYLKYTEAPRYYNRLLDAWESRYADNRIEGIHILRKYCEDQYHLQVPQIPTKKTLNYRTRAMIQKRHKRSAHTIASCSIKWKELKRKVQIAHNISATTLNTKCYKQHNLQINGEEEEEEVELWKEEHTDESFAQINVFENL